MIYLASAASVHAAEQWTSPDGGLVSVSASVVDGLVRSTLTVRSGQNAETFVVKAMAPRVSSLVGGTRRLEGQSLREAGRPTLEGSGTLTPVSLLSGTPACSPFRNRFHGFELRIATYRLTVHPMSTVQMATTWQPTSSARWASTEYVPTFVVRSRDDTSEQALTPRETVRPFPTLGSEIVLDSSPRVDAVPARARPTVLSAGRTLTIRGYIRPRRRSVPVTLKVLLPESRRLTTFARLHTDGTGRFAHRWRPRKRGRYEVWAFTTSTNYACPFGFAVD